VPESNDNPPIVRCRKLNKAYGDLHVLRDLDFDVNTGEHVAIIGPSGSGKSTLLRLIMTLERPTSGTIEVDGDYLWHEQRDGKLVPASRAHIRQVRSHVGMVFQHFNLFPHMKVLRNITEAPVRVLGMTRRDARQRARELLDLVGLADKADAYPDELSGGQKQRVAIARALALQPTIMLFDEVTSALDPELVGEVQQVLRQIAHDTDMTMLLVTHQMNFAREIADRVVFFDAGNIVEDDTPAVIFNEPREPRTQQFLKAVLDAT
jgi:polar amino acid transport system ATP-binding protein